MRPIGLITAAILLFAGGASAEEVDGPASQEGLNVTWTTAPGLAPVEPAPPVGPPISQPVEPVAAAQVEAAPVEAAPTAQPAPPEEIAPPPAPPAPPAAAAAHSETAPTADASVEPRTPLGLTLGVEVASSYIFRGLNLFQTRRQLDQNYLVAPGVSYSVPRTSLTLSYWGGFQMSGGNEADLVAGGVGHEQDLVAQYDFDLIEDTLALGLGLIWYFYPFADAEAAGASFPNYLEPYLELSYSGPVDLTLMVSHVAGLPAELRTANYTSLRASLGRSFELRSWLALSMGLTLGFKVFNRPSQNPDNVFDVQLDWSLDVTAAPGLTLSPGVHLAWTNLESQPAGEEYALWWGLATSFEL